MLCALCGEKLAGDDFNPDFSRPGPVKFAEIKALPGSQSQAAVFDDEGFRGADEGGFNMGGRISFRVLVGAGQGDQTVEVGKNIVLDAGIGIFIDCYCGGRMGNKNPRRRLNVNG